MKDLISGPYKLLPRKSSEHKPIIYLSPNQKSSWGLDKNITNIEVQVGGNKVIAQIFTTYQSLRVIHLSSKLMDSLGLFPGINLRLFIPDPTTICLGPIIAIMVDSDNWNNLREGRGLKELVSSEKWARNRGHLVYFFTVHQVLQDHKLVKGIYFNPVNKAWEVKWLPFPNAVYDRANFPGNPLHLTRAISILRNFKSMEWINVLNFRRTFGNFETASCLNFFQDTRRYIPDFALIHEEEDLADFLTKWKEIFIKEEYGNYGEQANRITTTDKGFICQSREADDEGIFFESIEKLYAYIKHNYGRNKIMAQQALKLQNINGHKFDLQVIMQKDNQDDWHMNLVVCRVARGNNIKTNITSEFREIVLDQENFSSYISNWTWKELEIFALHCVTAHESHYGVHGEIELILGLDSDHNLWLLKANSKPSTMHLLPPLLYAEYLLKCRVSDKYLLPTIDMEKVPVIRLSSQLCTTLGIEYGQTILIQAGLTKRQGTVIPDYDATKKDDNNELSSFWDLPSPVEWDYKFENGTLFLGPVVGYVTTQDIFLKPEKIKSLTSKVEFPTKGLTYLFNAEDIDNNKNLVASYQMIQKKDTTQCLPALLPLTEKGKK